MVPLWARAVHFCAIGLTVFSPFYSQALFSVNLDAYAIQIFLGGIIGVNYAIALIYYYIFARSPSNRSFYQQLYADPDIRRTRGARIDSPKALKWIIFTAVILITFSIAILLHILVRKG
jgi:hypothetical protein